MTNPDNQPQRTQPGDLAEFDTLVDLYYPSCLRVAWNRLGNREDAEDVVQDALIHAYQAIRRDGAPRRFRPWLITIVIRHCASLEAKQARRRRLFTIFRRQAESAAHPVAPWEPDEWSDTHLQSALESLSTPLREAFLLKHVEDLTYDEMAQATGVGVSALKMRVKRASEQLVAQLTDGDVGKGLPGARRNERGSGTKPELRPGAQHDG